VSITLIVRPNKVVVLMLEARVILAAPELDLKTLLPIIVFPVALFPLPVRPTKTKVLGWVDNK